MVAEKPKEISIKATEVTVVETKTAETPAADAAEASIPAEPAPAETPAQPPQVSDDVIKAWVNNAGGIMPPEHVFQAEISEAATRKQASIFAPEKIQAETETGAPQAVADDPNETATLPTVEGPPAKKFEDSRPTQIFPRAEKPEENPPAQPTEPCSDYRRESRDEAEQLRKDNIRLAKENTRLGTVIDARSRGLEIATGNNKALIEELKEANVEIAKIKAAPAKSPMAVEKPEDINSLPPDNLLRKHVEGLKGEAYEARQAKAGLKLDLDAAEAEKARLKGELDAIKNAPKPADQPPPKQSVWQKARPWLDIAGVIATLVFCVLYLGTLANRIWPAPTLGEALEAKSLAVKHADELETAKKTAEGDLKTANSTIKDLLEAAKKAADANRLPAAAPVTAVATTAGVITTSNGEAAYRAGSVNMLARGIQADIDANNARPLTLSEMKANIARHEERQKQLASEARFSDPGSK